MRPDDITDEERHAARVEVMPGVCEFDAENVAARVRAMTTKGDES